MESVTFTIRIDEGAKRELDNIALEENRSLNNLVETILINYIDNKE